MTGRQKLAEIFTLQVGTETTSHFVFSLLICPLGIEIDKKDPKEIIKLFSSPPQLYDKISSVNQRSPLLCRRISWGTPICPVGRDRIAAC